MTQKSRDFVISFSPHFASPLNLYLRLASYAIRAGERCSLFVGDSFERQASPN